MSKKFIRTDFNRFSKLGKGRKKLQVWRRARGSHSKIRRKRRGYPVMPGIGYRTPRVSSGLIKGLRPVVVHNMAEVQSLDKKAIIILSATVDARKKLDIIKKAQEKGISILNIGGRRHEARA